MTASQAIELPQLNQLLTPTSIAVDKLIQSH